MADVSRSHQLAGRTKPPPTSQRVLACVTCSQRKVKCDRNYPCGNCKRLHIECIHPITSLRRRRRRFPEGELLERLRRYEYLLRQNNIDFEALHPTQPVNNHTNDIWDAQRYDDADRDGSPEDDDDGEEEDPSMYEKHVVDALNQIEHYSEDQLLLLVPNTGADLFHVHPQQLDVFKLWQIYVERVDPILKVTHTPTLQASVTANAGEPKGLASSTEALMFGIYCSAVLSLTDQECQDTFAATRAALLKRYQLGCRQALSRCKFLHTEDRHCLTGLFLYLVSIKPDVDRRSLSSLLGTVIRIAQGMSIHTESANSKHPVFEAEMRRRLWWAIVLFDNRVCEPINNCPSTILVPTWDCKPPSNYNDFEMRPDMKSTPFAHVNPSEALYVVVRSHYGNYLRQSDFHLDLINPLLRGAAQNPQSRIGKAASELDTIEQHIKAQYTKNLVMENPLHFLTIWTMRSQIAKSRLLRHYWKHSRSPTQQTESQRDQATSHALAVIECESQLVGSPLTKGFRWHISHFPFPAYVHVMQDLRRRPHQLAAGRAWEMMSADFRARFENFPLDGHPFFTLFARVVLQAWESRDTATDTSGQKIEVPWIVEEVKRILAPSAQTKVESNMPHTQGMDFELNFDQFLPGFDGVVRNDGQQNTLALPTYDAATWGDMGPLEQTFIGFGASELDLASLDLSTL